jgi:hypothetical protein
MDTNMPNASIQLLKSRKVPKSNTTYRLSLATMKNITNNKSKNEKFFSLLTKKNYQFLNSLVRSIPENGKRNHGEGVSSVRVE